MQLSWTLPALGDLEAIGDFVAEYNPEAAHELVGHILDRTQRLLSENPDIGRRGRVAGTRELVIGKTSYIVVYRVARTVEILAVVHGARAWPEHFD